MTDASTDRCPVCDAVLATDADFDASRTRGLPQARIAELCWSVVFGSRCIRPPVDWRARALAAEARLRARDIVCIPDEQVEMVRGYIAGVDPMDVPVVDVQVLRADSVREFYRWLIGRDTFLPGKVTIERWLSEWLRGDP